MESEVPPPAVADSSPGDQPPPTLWLPLPLSEPPPIEPDWARRLRWIGPLGPLVTMTVLFASAYVAYAVYSESREQNAAQRRAALGQQVLLRQSIDQNTIAHIYAMGMETSKVLIQYPELRIYFESNEDYRLPAAKEDAAQRRERLNQCFDKEPEATKQRVWSYCQVQADFFEYTFVLRHLLPESDWEGWWLSFCDSYDESHLLRAYLMNRHSWHTIDDVLGLPKAQRDAWFTEDAARIAQLKK